MSRDYYAVLEIAVGATPAQVKRAYQRLARRYSPDVNLWERDARALFDEIAEAYRVLRDPMARALYDRRQGSAGSGRSSGAGEGVARGRRGEDLHVAVELAFQHAVAGLSTDVPVDRLSPCRACDASGAARGSALAPCTYCGGLGNVWSGHGAPSAES